jgi:hypothetical protein
MKNNKNLSFALALSVVFCACEKKNIEPALTSTDANLKSAPTAQRVDSRNSYKGSTGWCNKAYIKDCTILPEIVVTPTSKLINLTHETDPALVGEAFLNDPDLASLADNLTGDDYAALCSGNYFIAVSAEDSGTISFIAGTSYPVTADNFSFAFQGNK